MIPLLRPSCTQAEIDAVADVLKSGWWGNGKVVEQFEKELAQKYNRKFAVTVNSATAALHLTMKALEISEGDEVITPALTFVSTGLAPLYVGATPIMADVDYHTLCIDWEDVRRKITKNTKAIIPVDYAGYPAAFKGIDLGVDGIPIIQDAAHSSGGIAYGDLICLSFHPVKNLATGDGGAILTDDPDIYERLKALRWCGIDRSTWDRSKDKYGWDYDIFEIGYKYHWNDIQAAIGLVQLRRLGELNEARERIAEFYRSSIKNDLVTHPCNIENHTWHLYPIRVQARERNKFVRYLLDKGISAGVHYKPLTHYPMFKGNVPVTEREWRKLVSLPIYYDLDIETQQTIVDVINNYWENV